MGDNEGIDITQIALVVVAALFFDAGLLSRGRWALVLLAAGLFTVLTVLAVAVDAVWMTALDTSVMRWISIHLSHAGRGSGAVFRYVGRPVHVAVVAAVAGTLLAVRARSVRPAVLATGAVVAGVVIERTLKVIVERMAPNPVPVHYPELLHYAHSFPSGHVTVSATLLGSIAVCLGAGRSRDVRAGLGILVATGVAFVAFVALCCGAHIFSDVVGGMVLGGAIVALCAASIAPATRQGAVIADGLVLPARERVTESPWFWWRLGLLDFDQGLVGPFCSVEDGFELCGR